MNGLDAPTKLSHDQIELCKDTISSLTFYKIVGDALVRRQPLSVVRMGDGEHRLMLDKPCGADWLDKLGLTGCPPKVIKARLRQAAECCTYFAPSITGIEHEDYRLHNMFSSRKRYVDNFFINAWDEQAKIKLFQEAKHVLLIHNNAATADSMQIRAQANLDVEVSYIPMANWTQTEAVLARAIQCCAPLVLFSGGPAGKYIAPKLAAHKKVVLDVGNSADQWTLSSLPADLEKAQAFHRRLHGD